MIGSLARWPYKWFGVWKEYGAQYEKYPSIKDFVEEKKNLSYDRKKLGEYLNNGFAVASTSRSSFPCPFTGKKSSGSISYRTDGKWLWLDDLFEYIENYNVVIPDEWYEEIRKRDFKIPMVDQDQIERLEWPML